MNKKEEMQLIEQFVKDNLTQGCRELVEFTETGILSDGVVRATSHHLQPICGHRGLMLAESLFRRLATEKVASRDD